VVALYNTFQDEHSVYMLMELADGGELYALLASQSAFPTPQVGWVRASC
jgi:serine/threonine protein kinase